MKRPGIDLETDIVDRLHRLRTGLEVLGDMLKCDQGVAYPPRRHSSGMSRRESAIQEEFELLSVIVRYKVAPSPTSRSGLGWAPSCRARGVWDYANRSPVRDVARNPMSIVYVD